MFFGFPAFDAVLALHVTSHHGFVTEVAANDASNLLLHQVQVSNVPAIRDVPTVLVVFAALAPGAVCLMRVQNPPVGKQLMADLALMLQKVCKKSLITLICKK